MAQWATATLENFRFRDKILSKQLLRLRYDLSPDHIRYTLGQIREALAQNGKVEEATSRVRLLKLGDNGLEVEIYAYILERDYGLYLLAQEEMLLQLMDVLERTGARCAADADDDRDSGYVDRPEKAAAARRAVEKQRDPGVPVTSVRN
jgi:MscS family membrane protein